MMGDCRNMKPTFSCFLAMMSIAVGASTARANWADESNKQQQQVPAAYRNVGVDEHLNAQLPLDLRFYDSKAQKVTLGDMFHHGRPVILQLGYLDCPMLCDQISHGLVESAKKIDLDIGKDFDFLFVSIDPTDSPDLAKIKLNSYVAEYGKPGSASGFHFLVGQESRDQAARRCRRVPVSAGAQRAVRPSGHCDGDHARRQNRPLSLRNQLSLANAAAVAGRGVARENRVLDRSDPADLPVL